MPRSLLSGPWEPGAGSGVSAGRVHTCCPGTSHSSTDSSSWLPPSAFAMSSNLSPQQPQRKHPSQDLCQGLHVAVGCQVAVLGAAGLAWGCQLFGFPLPAGAPQTPIWPLRSPHPGKGTKALHSEASMLSCPLEPPTSPRHASSPKVGTCSPTCPVPTSRPLSVAPELAPEW